MRRHFDYPLFLLTVILVVTGLLLISSASIVVSEKNFDTPYYYVTRQAVYALAGLGVLLVFQAVPYRFWRVVALPALLASLALTAAVFIPKLGFATKGATRWLDIGPATIQPSELLKISLILYLASWLDRKKSDIRSFTASFIPFVVVLGTVGALLVLQPDIGTLLVIGGAAVLVYFLGGSGILQIIALGVLAAVALGVVVAVEPYRANRIIAFLDPSASPQGIGYHINQALIAIGSGGFWGRGFGQSIQKHSYLPEPMGDSIFAVLVEEMGFLGGLLLILAYFAFFARSMIIARRVPDGFGKLVVAGFGALITLQAFINMAAISGFLPLTGIPLPFISYGGTALVVTLGMVGIMLAVSKRAT